MAIIIPYVKQTWTDGSGGGTPVSAARLGVLEEGILDVSFAPAVRVSHNASQSILNNTLTTLAFNSERFDQAGGVASTMHDTVTNNSRLTAIYAGIYFVNGQIEWSAAPVASMIDIRLNGATVIAEVYNAATGGDQRRQHVTTLYNMAVNDYVELRVYQNSGGAINVNSAGNYSPEFMMARVG